MIADLEAHLRDCWSAIAARRPEPRRLHFLKLSLTDYPDPLTALLFLVFADDARDPVAVAKVARVEASDAGIRLEANRLQLAHRCLPRELASVVPQFLRCATTNERPFLLTCSLPGEVELHHTWGARRAQRSEARIVSALSWALQIAQAAPSEPIGINEWLGLDAPEPLLDMLRAADWSADDLSRMQSRLRDLQSVRWPAGFAHGDFFAGNTLFDGDALSGVVDWGMARERAPIFFDVLTYEVAFSLHALASRGEHDMRDTRAVQHLSPFRGTAERLGALGIETGVGSPARLATLIAGVLSSDDTWGQRRHTAQRYERLLRTEVTDSTLRGA